MLETGDFNKKKVRDTKDGEWTIPTITMKAQEALEALGLLESCENTVASPKKRGRPKGSKNKK